MKQTAVSIVRQRTAGIAGRTAAGMVRWAAACILRLAITVTALAASPEFARTAEEWESLRDNVLEYSEIPELIQEYNVTVLNNQQEYNEFIKDYGKTREDIANSYLELAGDLEDAMTGDDSGMGLVSDMQLELQAKQMREQADDVLEDSQIYAWTYAMARDNLTLTAQSRFLSYYKKQLELQSAEAELASIKNDAALMETRCQAGMATYSDVLTAQEKVLTQEKAVEAVWQETEDTRGRLLVMLGWKSTDQPIIGEVPEIQMEEIDGIDLEADKGKALETNYTLKINKRKLENAQDSYSKTKLQNTIQSNEKQIEVSVASAWQNLQSAKRSYLLAQSENASQQRTMEVSEQKWSTGMITRYEYEKQQSSLLSSENAVEVAKLSLVESLETYRWNVNGLAAAE